MSKDEEIAITGRQLVADYQSIMISLATSQIAQHEAERSEQELLQNLASSVSGNYLNPNNMTEAVGDNVARASLDSHIKKVQADQIKSLSAAQLKSIVAEDKKSYIGKKVRITAIDKEYQPFDSLWFDPQKGYRNYEFKKKVIEGTIEELMLEKNILFIKPKFIRRLFVSDLKNFMVYVINPSNAEPAVEIEIL